MEANTSGLVISKAYAIFEWVFGNMRKIRSVVNTSLSGRGHEFSMIISTHQYHFYEFRSFQVPLNSRLASKCQLWTTLSARILYVIVLSLHFDVDAYATVCRVWCSSLIAQLQLFTSRARNYASKLLKVLSCVKIILLNKRPRPIKLTLTTDCF